MHCFQPGSEIIDQQQLLLHGPVHVGAGTVLHASGGISLGANVVISYHCVLWTVNHDYEGNCLPYGLARLVRPIVLGDNVWLGRNVLVAPGTHIGEGAVVAMGSVVSGHIPPLAIIAGNPAKVVKYRSPRRYLAHQRQALTLWHNASDCPACNNPGFYLAEQGGACEWHWAWRYLPKRLRLRLQQGIIRRLLQG